MTDAARDLAPMANSDGSDPNVWSEYEIETQTSLVDRALRSLKHGDAFAVLDSFGDIGTMKDTAEGLFYRDTRYLSHYELRIEGKRPLLLSSAMHEDKAALSVALTNPDIHVGEHDRVARDTISLERTKFVWNAVCYERVSIRNFDHTRRRLRLDVLFDADFRDLFEVRGTKRRRRGRHMAHPHRPDRAEFRYEGLDGIERRTVLSFRPAPSCSRRSRSGNTINGRGCMRATSRRATAPAQRWRGVEAPWPASSGIGSCA
jgi:glycogen debranching enzyme